MDTVNVKVTFNATINKDFLPMMEKFIDHHIEYLIDTNGNPEIKNIYDAKMEVIKED